MTSTVSKSVAAAAGTAIVAVAATSAVTIGTSAADPADPRARTLAYVVVYDPDEQASDDLPPTGISAGDRFVFAGDLRQGGSKVGRFFGSDLAVDGRYQGAVQSFVLLVPGGSLILEGGLTNLAVSGTPAPARQQLAILGGTGKYAGARGDVTTKDLSATRQRFTITLR